MWDILDPTIEQALNMHPSHGRSGIPPLAHILGPGIACGQRVLPGKTSSPKLSRPNPRADMAILGKIKFKITILIEI